MRKNLWLLSLILITFPLQAENKTPKVLAELDAFVPQVLRTFQVPGVSVAIVKDGAVLLTKGYGVRKLGEPTPVDAQTLFGIASNTKAFTATALALLVEAGQIEWDAPVINYLPGFQFADPYITRELTVRDLLVHRSGLGLGAGDLLWWPSSDYSRKEIVRQLRYVPLATSFRTTYAYDNVLYIAAGEVIEAVTGQRWEEFIQTRIFAPVGMTLSQAEPAGILTADNAAATHAEIDGQLQLVEPFVNANIGAAGAINSCAEDLAHWMIVQLDSGRLANGEQLFKSKTTRELWGLVTPIPVAPPAPELAPLRSNFSGYALGFGVREYRGYKMVTHTGALPGFLSRLTLLPELKIGVAVLTNQESGYAFNAITYYVLDRLLKAPPHDWLAALKLNQTKSESKDQAALAAAQAARDSTSRPSHPLVHYTGTYRDRWYGEIQIRLEADQLRLQFTHTPVLVGILEHWQYNTFVVRWLDRELRADAYLTFALNPDGSIEQAKMQAVSDATDFSFDFQDLLLKPVKAQ